MGLDVYTIGHSTHPIERFVELLRRHEITAIADVRSSPYSRLNPQYNRDLLTKSLRANGIVYSFVGKELGARPADPWCYDAYGRAHYERIAQTELFRGGIERVLEGAGKYRVALMCAEKDPMTCHRSILVCRHLVQRGAKPLHVLASGAIEAHDSGLARIASEFDLPFPDLHRSDAEVREDLYKRRGQQIEYVESSARKELA